MVQTMPLSPEVHSRGMNSSHRECMQATPTGKGRRVVGRDKSSAEEDPPAKFTITRQERKVTEELRRDKTRMILTVDKGASMVVMDRDEYNQKADALLQQPACRPIPNDPTNKYKTKLIALLKSIKTEGGINESAYKRLYSTGQDHQILWITKNS